MEKNVIDDVWYEIFLRPPLDSIFKFRCISKLWFSILSNPNFLKQWYKLNNRSLPWAFLGHFVNRGQPRSPLNRMITYPDSHSQFISNHHNGFSFSFLPDPELYVLGSANVTWDSYICDNLVAHNGVWYLLQKCNNKILTLCVNGNTNHGTRGNECRLTNIPDQPVDDFRINGQCLGESEGLACYARYKVVVRSLSVWVLDGDWYMLCKDVSLHDMLAEIDVPAVAIQILGFNPSDKNVVILSDMRYIWAFNTTTRGYEQLYCPSFLSNVNYTIPHIIVLAFSTKSMPTIVPPICRRDTSILDI